MQIFLSQQVNSISGMIDKKTGYFIVPRKEKNGKIKFFGVRKRGDIPEDGHLRFILQCAGLAYSKIYVKDVKVTPQEMWDALIEAGKHQAAEIVLYNDVHSILASYNASDIVNLQTTFGL